MMMNMALVKPTFSLFRQ